MLYPTYCSQGIDPSYIHLVRFARLSGWQEHPFQQVDEDIVQKALKGIKASTQPIGTLLPLIYHNLQKTTLYDDLPGDIKTHIKQIALVAIVKEMRNKQRLAAVFNAFNNHNIPVMLLKGAAFSSNIYPGKVPRLGVDLDLFIGKENFNAASNLLSEIMQTTEATRVKSASYSANFERAYYPGKHPGGFGFIEIHKQIKNPYIFNINEQALWDSSREHPEYKNRLVRTLSPEYTLLHLAVHAFRDLNYCHHNLLDAHEVFCQWQPDPEQLVKLASNWGAKHVLFMLLDNCRTMMETPVDPSLLESLKPSRATNWINKAILQSDILQRDTHETVGYRFLQLASQISLPDSTLRGILFQFHYIKTKIMRRN